MFAFLKRFNIIQISITTLVLFILLIAALSGFTIFKTFQQSAGASRDMAALTVIEALEQIAHHHAVERGLTAGYLGAPSPERLSALKQQRQKADNSVVALESVIAEGVPESFLLDSYLLPLQNHLANKRRIRTAVENQSAPEAFAFYSLLNRYALDIAEFINANTENKMIRDSNKGILLFAQFKERAGQLRGKINGVLARQRLTPSVQAELSGYFQDIEIIKTHLNNVLSDEQRIAFNGIINNTNSQSIVSTASALIDNPAPNFSSLPTSDVWFPQATKQIVEVKGLLDKQIAQSNSIAEQARSAAQQFLITLVTLILIVIAVIVMLNVFLVVNLGKELRKLTNTLNRVAQQGDLTLDVRIDSRNELGYISKAIHGTINSFKDLVTGLAASIEANRRLNVRLEETTATVNSHAKESQLLSDSIATSIEEMSATSEEIAQSAASSLESCSNLNKSVSDSAKMNQQTNDAMRMLTSEMSSVEQKANAMESQLSEITGMLETIDSVAEQTNLLALNAAIEAARAGEQGRGFAVVADEVRSLAQSSKASSDKIAQLLTGLGDVSQQMITSIRTTVKSADDTLDTTNHSAEVSAELLKLAESVENVTTSVAAAAEEQSVVAQQIASDALNVANAAQAEVDAMEEMNKISGDLDTNSKTLERTMLSFKIK